MKLPNRFFSSVFSGRWGRLLAACLAGAAAALPAAAKVRVVATTGQVADLARNVAGDLAEVEGLMGPGVDPHLYRATARDVMTMQRADLILYSGLALEGRLGDVFTRVGRQGRPIYAVTEQIPRERLLEPEEFEGHYDPHVWFDPTLWELAIDVVVEALGRVDPDNAETYQRNGEAYRQELRELHAWAKERVAQIPPERRILVTSHDAYNYFGHAYGIEVVGIQGISTATEAGLGDVVSMVRYIEERGVPAIFVESSVSPDLIRRVSSDSGAEIGGELFSDAMGDPGEIHEGPDGERYDVGAYTGMFKHNVNTIVEALKAED